MLICGALALAAFPGTSGFFSKDEILAFAATRGGMYWIFAIGGYIGAIMTAFYSFRIVFRVVYGDPVPEAKELERGHLAHAEPANPATGEPEDTDVGFPGAEHHIAEREWPMKVAMGDPRVRRPVRRADPDPRASPTSSRASSTRSSRPPRSPAAVHVSTTDAYIGMAVGGLCSLLGIGAAFYLYMVAPGSTLRLRDRFHRTPRLPRQPAGTSTSSSTRSSTARSSRSAGSPTTPSSGS